MSKYTTHPNHVARSDGAIIPLDPANRDYQDYLAYNAANPGQTPNDTSPSP